MVFLYLSTVVPSIWFLELNLLESKLESNGSSVNDSSSHGSSGHEFPALDHIRMPEGIKNLEPENWVQGLEQTMLIVLVLGRWLMPKGDMSRDQLSQLLVNYVGLGADILDILDTFKEPEIKNKWPVAIAGLALFSWALMQFPLVPTQTQSPKGEPPQGRAGGPTCLSGAPGSFASCCSSEVWSLLITVGLQDGPFLIYRIYLMAQERVLNQLMIFFTCKNILSIVLELYRILVVQCEQQGAGARPERRAARVLQRQAREGSEEEEGVEEDAGKEEDCGGQSCHDDVEGGSHEGGRSEASR
ncbi:transmembrane protein 26 [Salarias fasciatus]|uniref:transmembrane protein 26 n=1 Tax=Salarias fasciatus TaxID=181472 RepID=UPI001176665A|nr:transmembrane protein 26-like [Salarias fasciatus]